MSTPKKAKGERLGPRAKLDAREAMVYEIAERRICWPDPDATCLHGGCVHCDHGPWVPLTKIERYARRHSLTGRELPHRGSGSEDAWHAYQYGLEHAFFNRDTRASRADLAAYAEAVPLLALREMAKGMPGGYEATRTKAAQWLLRHRRQVLDDSFRIGAQARHGRS